MNSEKLRLYIIEFTLVIFFLLALIFNNIITRQIIAIVLLVFMVLSVKLIKNDKLNLTNSKQIIILLSAIGIIYVALLYILGVFTEFYSSPIKLSIWSILNYIIPYIVIIVSAEIIRKAVLLKVKGEKWSKIIITIAMVMLDVIVTTNIYNLKSVNDYFTLVTFVIFASIANNLLFNYIIIQYRNEKAIIGYRLITTLYPYIFPITPNIYIFLESIIKMVIPYIIFIILENIYSKKTNVITVENKRKQIISTIIVIIGVLIVIMLVSCKFWYGVLVIGSGSMTGTIDKGDIVFYKKYSQNEEIKTGDIIVFAKDDLKIVHRVIDQRLMGEETRYYTKGDANQQEDDGYTERKNIFGKVKAKIPYIGYLTLWINDLIGGKN